jgi:putative acetyltransferase
MTALEVRPERPEDRARVWQFHASAFPTRAEADLVDALRTGGRAVISLVATDGADVVGHVLFSPVTIDDKPAGLGLAPVAVVPGRQRQGIGSRLINEALAECKRTGVPLAVVLGEPAYYSRFGFSRADARGLTNDYDAGEHFMVLELTPGAIPPGGGHVRYAPEFGQLAG